MSDAREGNLAKRVCSETRSASPGDLCCARGVTHTGYAKVGDSRVFLPLNAWQVNWVKNVAGFARSEAVVYGARLKTTPITEINLLEVKSEDPRAEVVFTMHRHQVCVQPEYIPHPREAPHGSMGSRPRVDSSFGSVFIS